ncbi:MAG: exosortase C-terminal domain/associated protein EpsI [Gemmatimonadaceae bacterium]
MGRHRRNVMVAALWSGATVVLTERSRRGRAINRSRLARESEILHRPVMAADSQSIPAPERLAPRARVLHVAAIALTAATFAVLFAQPIANLARTWWTSPDAGHGLLLVPLALFLAYRSGVRPGARGQVALGIAIVVAAVALRYVSAVAAEAFFGRASIAIAAAGLVTYAWGLRQLLAWWLPVALIALAMPLPEIVLSSLALPLQMKASQIGAVLLESRQVPVVLTGNVVRLPGHDLFVTEACSGLRSLAALLSLGVLLGGLVAKHPITRVAIVAISIPIAVLLNGIRVFMTGFLVLFVSPSAADGFSHMTEGWLMFIVAFGLLAIVTWLAVKIEKRFLGQRSDVKGHSAPHATPQTSDLRPQTFGRVRLALPATVMAIGVVLIQAATRQTPIQLSAPLKTMPLSLAGYLGDERPVTEEEQRVAGMSDYVFRVFSRDTSAVFSVYVGYYESQVTGRTIHSPKNCLPGAGWQQVESGRKNLTVNGQTVTVNRYILANGPSQAVVYYWYQGRGRVAWSEYRVKWDLLRDAAKHGRTEEALVRIMVPLSAPTGGSAAELGGRIQRADDVATRAAAELLPQVERVLPRWQAAPIA